MKKIVEIGIPKNSINNRFVNEPIERRYRKE